MQIVGYATESRPPEARDDPDDGPSLFVADDGEVEPVPLAPGTELAYALGERHCAGTVHDGGHVACAAADAPHCRDHRSYWPCARCQGDCDKPIDNCDREHVVYLAAFAPDLFKVGVTKPDRLETRLREQGADRGALLRRVRDGRIAREVEAEIAATVGDAVRVDRKIEGLAREVDADAWRALRSGFDVRETFAFDYGLSLPASPVAETIAAGTVRGIKGRLLVVERAGTAYAVDMRELVGHEVTRGAADRDLQSSLDAFG